MNTTWVEPSARDVPCFSPEQVERGRRLVGRDDLLTGERQHTRVEVGDLLLEIAPDLRKEDEHAFRQVVADFAAEIGISADRAREYRRVATEYSPHLRELVRATGLPLSYSVIREAAIDTAGSGKAAPERWNALLEMLESAARSGKRVTAQKYRQAIGARLTVDAGIGLTPDRIIQQLAREDIRSTMVDCITEPQFLREVLLADPVTELKVRESLAAVDRLDHQAGAPAQPNAMTDERLLLQLRRRVNSLRQVVQMRPEQILNIADRDTLDDLTDAFQSLADWIAQIERRKEHTS